jgi:phenylpropionate dioxygenase-like ring-hydroxylating dioxygenase large terminal subunit
MKNVNYSGVAESWFPLLMENQLKQKPLSVRLMDQSLVVVRLAGKIKCFLDVCPHRMMPLSLGRIEGNNLACCYHGWQFDNNGDVCKIPGLDSPSCNVSLKSFSVIKSDGLLWVNLSESAVDLPLTFQPLPNFIFRQYYRQVNCSLFHTIENFLDACHTPYVHSGLLRNRGQQRMSVNLKANENGFTADYALHSKQNGWVNKIFDPGIERNVARFTLPGRVELDYIKAGRLLFRVGLYFVPLESGITGIYSRVYLKRSIVPSCLRFALLYPFMSRVFQQDKIVLERQRKAQLLYGERYVFSHADIVAQPLLDLLQGRKPSCEIDTELIL